MDALAANQAAAMLANAMAVPQQAATMPMQPMQYGAAALQYGAALAPNFAAAMPMQTMQFGAAPLATAMAPSPGGLPAGWEQFTDPSSGKIYYGSKTTGETSWTPPAGAGDGAAALASATAPAASPSSAPGTADAQPASAAVQTQQVTNVAAQQPSNFAALNAAFAAAAMPMQPMQYGAAPLQYGPAMTPNVRAAMAASPYAGGGFPQQQAMARPQAPQFPSRPPDMVPVPGLTDRRFEGIVAAYFPDKQFGFIRCEELRATKFPEKDIFVHKRQLMHFNQGDRISFSVSLNKQNKPQAMELGPPGPNAPLVGGNVPGAAAAGPGAAMQAAEAPKQAVAGPQSTTPLPPVPPPPPVAPQVADDFASEEVDVPPGLVEELRNALGVGAKDIVGAAGGDITVSFVTHAKDVTKVHVRGPKTSVTLGATLVLQKIIDLR